MNKYRDLVAAYFKIRTKDTIMTRSGTALLDRIFSIHASTDGGRS